MKEIMMHSFCEKLNSASLCIKFDKYNCIIYLKRYLWSLQLHTIVNKNRYLTYQQNENEHYMMKQINSIKMTMFNE